MWPNYKFCMQSNLYMTSYDNLVLQVSPFTKEEVSGTPPALFCWNAINFTREYQIKGGGEPGDEANGLPLHPVAVQWPQNLYIHVIIIMSSAINTDMNGVKDLWCFSTVQLLST